MSVTEFKPGEPGREVPVQLSEGTLQNKERRLNGPQEALKGNIENTFNDNNTGKISQPQAYPVRWLEERFGLSRAFAALIAAEVFRLGGA
jgi:hypothetical protein